MSTYLKYSEAILIGTTNFAAETGAVLKTKLIPRGTFAGTVYELGLVENGQLVASDTGEQGAGQN